ncbi:hypothetical protein Hypma_011644 [Hypsizygus marmoreus]|uniref:SAP domain-containing protein n=1 Tax=Hypsizygus marmoreus TaxID=39966 RepID=A0A369JPV4_HYPMA|nr:hypothetical protein Hypma_011644 [Hypsizygus marmoreus]
MSLFRPAVSRLATLVRQRNFVSSVLLTRTYENESVAALKREIKVRGLSPKGNKANLIQTLQEHDKAKTFEEIASGDPPVPAGARAMGTAATSSDIGIAPGIPPEAHPTPAPPQAFLNVVIPDVSQPDPTPSVQIPYVPDFWDSSTPVKEPVEEPRPKLVVVAGAETHPGGGPSLKMLDENVAVESDNAPAFVSDASTPREPGQGGIWDDVAEDIGIPNPKEIKNAFWKLFS